MTVATESETRRAAPRRRPARHRWIAVLVIVGIVTALAVVIVARVRADGGNAVTGTFYTVEGINLDVTVAKGGDLEAVNNIDIQNKVDGSSIITMVVDEGTLVHKGDILMRLDSSDISEKLQDQMLSVQQAEADFTSAKEMKDIQISQNTADIDAAQVKLQLAKLALKQYVEGTYPQSLANARTNVETQQIYLKNMQETLSQTRSLFEKSFVTPMDVKTAEQDAIDAQNKLDQANTALEVLTNYTHPMDLASKQSDVAQAEQKLSATKRQATSNLAQKDATLVSAQQRLVIQKRRLEYDQEQLADCVIRAPADGIVIYGTSGQRNVQNPIQEGTTVRGRQLLIRLPDTSHMKVVVMINEAQVPELKVGQTAQVRITGVNHSIPAKVSYISPVVDNSQRWWNPDLRQYPVDVTLDQTPAGLKPGSSAQVTIFIKQLTGALSAPLAAIYTTGNDSYVFVRQPDGDVRATKVKLGDSNGTFIQLASGIHEGDQVLLLGAGQGRQLAERAGIDVSDRSTRKKSPQENEQKPTTQESRTETKPESVAASSPP